MRLAIVLLVASLAAGCRDVRNDGSVCPDQRDLRCVAGTRCSMDEKRGCKVCQCEPLDDSAEPDRAPDDVYHPAR